MLEISGDLESGRKSSECIEGAHNVVYVHTHGTCTDNFSLYVIWRKETLWCNLLSNKNAIWYAIYLYERFKELRYFGYVWVDRCGVGTTSKIQGIPGHKSVTTGAGTVKLVAINNLLLTE